MATGRQIVLSAFREGNLVASGATLTEPQLTEGLQLLNEYIESLLGLEFGEIAFDWPFRVTNLSRSETRSRFPLFPRQQDLPLELLPFPPSNVRVLMSIDNNDTIYFPPLPEDGARMAFLEVSSPSTQFTVRGNGRLIEGQLSLVTTPQEISGRRYFYRADLGNWVRIEAVTADSTPFLPPVFDELLTLGLLERLVGRSGRELTASQDRRFRRILVRAKGQYEQNTPEVVDEYNVFLYPYSDYFRERTLIGTGDLI